MPEPETTQNHWSLLLPRLARYLSARQFKQLRVLPDNLEQFDADEARKLQQKIAKNQFNFDDFLGQIQQIKKMGNLKDLAAMIPGMGKMVKDIDMDDDAFKSVEAIISSMTPLERAEPGVINGSRRKRIASGSGTSIQEVNRLIKQFDDTRKAMRMMSKGKNLSKLMGNMSMGR